MVALQIRDVPDDVRRRLADRAAARGQSLQSFLLALVTEEAERSANLAIVQRFAERTDGSRLSAAEATHAVDRARAEREGRVAAARDPR
jgi:plasmid stability protein